MSLTRFIHLSVCVRVLVCVCVLGRVFAVSCHLENFIIKLRVAAKDSRAGGKGEAGAERDTVGRMEMLASFAR